MLLAAIVMTPPFASPTGQQDPRLIATGSLSPSWVLEEMWVDYRSTTTMAPGWKALPFAFCPDPFRKDLPATEYAIANVAVLLWHSYWEVSFQ